MRSSYETRASAVPTGSRASTVGFTALIAPGSSDPERVLDRSKGIRPVAPAHDDGE